MAMLDVPLGEGVGNAADSRYSRASAITVAARKARRYGRVAPKPLSVMDFKTAEVFSELMLEKLARAVSGRIAHSGGLWIRPDPRKLNLSGYLDHLGRALMVRNFWFDHMTAFIVDKLAATGIGVRQYGFPGIAGWIEFNFFTFRPVRLAYCHMTRAESVSRMRRWLEQPEAENIAEPYA